MARYATPTIPFVEARNVGPKQKPTSIVLSLSATTSEKGAALGIANYHHKMNAPTQSYHYILDSTDTFQCVPDEVMAYCSPYRSLNVLICAQPHEEVALWEDGSATRVMYRAADLIADLILGHKIRPRYLDEDAEHRWIRHKWRRNGGLIVRAIGTWPYESFLDDVKSRILIKTSHYVRR